MKWIHISKAKPVFGQLYLTSTGVGDPELAKLSAITASGFTFEGIAGNTIYPTHIAIVSTPEAETGVSNNDNLALNG